MAIYWSKPSIYCSWTVTITVFIMVHNTFCSCSLLNDKFFKLLIFMWTQTWHGSALLIRIIRSLLYVALLFSQVPDSFIVIYPQSLHLCHNPYLKFPSWILDVLQQTYSFPNSTLPIQTTHTSSSHNQCHLVFLKEL